MCLEIGSLSVKAREFALTSAYTVRPYRPWGLGRGTQLGTARESETCNFRLSWSKLNVKAFVEILSSLREEDKTRW